MDIIYNMIFKIRLHYSQKKELCTFNVDNVNKIINNINMRIMG